MSLPGTSWQPPNVMMILHEPPAQHQAAPLSPSTQTIPHINSPSDFTLRVCPNTRQETSFPTPFHGANSITVFAATSTSPKATHSQLLKCYQFREHRCRQRRQLVVVKIPVRMSLPCASWQPPNVMILREQPTQHQAASLSKHSHHSPQQRVHFTLRVCPNTRPKISSPTPFRATGPTPSAIPHLLRLILHTSPVHHSCRGDFKFSQSNTLTVFEVQSVPRTPLQAASSARYR